MRIDFKSFCFAPTNKVRRRTKETLEGLTNNQYPFESFGAGRLLGIISLGEKSGIKLNCSNYRHLGDTVRKIAQEDFEAAYSIFEKIAIGIYGIGIPPIDAPEWLRPKTEAEMLLYFAQKERLRGIKFSSEEEKEKVFERIEEIEEKQTKSDFLKFGTDEINMQVLELENVIGFLRKKEPVTYIAKNLDRLIKIVNPSEQDIATMKSELNYSDAQSFQEYCFHIIPQALAAPGDIYEYLAGLTQNIGVERITSLFMFDIGGLKLVAQDSEIYRIDSYIGNRVNAEKLKVLMQYENNLALGEKDKAIAYGFNGQYSRTFVEVREQPLSAFFESEYGLRAHSEQYKPKMKKNILKFLDHKIISESARRLCGSLQVKERDLENYLKK